MKIRPDEPAFSMDAMNRARDFNMTPAILAAVEVHKYFLSKEIGDVVPITNAISHFLLYVSDKWESAKTMEDNQRQKEAMNEHRWHVSELNGRDAGTAAYCEWVMKYAQTWRNWRESLPVNGFVQLFARVDEPELISLKIDAPLSTLAAALDCDLFLSTSGVAEWDFTLQRKHYVNMKSWDAVKCGYIPPGEIIEILAAGKQAKEALEAIGKFLTGQGGGSLLEPA